MTPEADFSTIEFGDKRLDKRLQRVIESSRKNVGRSILGCEKGRNTAKGFYRLLSNERFDIEQMKGAAKRATISRMTGTVLLVQDTSDINLNGHKKTEGLGYCSEYVRGIKLHSCIAISPEGVPFGLVAQQYETREEAKSRLSKAEKAARQIEKKESFRWLEMLEESTKDIPEGIKVVTICDREGDFYELYAKASELKKDFIIRVIHDRRLDENERIASKVRKISALCKVTVNIPRDSRRGIPVRQTEMEIAKCSVNILKPTSVRDPNIIKKLSLNLVRITELTPLEGQEPIEWILATSLPLNNETDVITIVEYYIQRWKIERFHYVLKSGCNAEKIQQRTYERIKPVLLIYSVIALFIMTATYLGRISPDMPCNFFFDDDEWKILYRIANKTKLPPEKPYSMADAIMYLGQLGGYKRAPSYGTPGLKIIWLGLFMLYQAIDILVGQD
jgi:hypothetical protein